MKTYKLNVGILTFPISEAGNIPLSNLINIMFASSYKMYLISGNEGYNRFKNDNRVECYGVSHKSGTNKVSRIIKYIFTQLKIACLIYKLRQKVDAWVFFIGADGLLIPMLVAKLTKKKVLFVRAGSAFESLSGTQDKSFLKPMYWLTKINLYLSDYIVVYSSIFIKHWNLEKYNDKVVVCSEHFININDFNITKKNNERQKMIGYIGRLSGEKGVSNFVEAIPLIKKSNNALNFIIGGDGNLRLKIDVYLKDKNLTEVVKLPGWISHDKLPKLLNELKLLVLPSYTEGLPNIMLEAMACGTPVLATPVGAIPDIIKDGETGFILEDNSPECIAGSVLKIIKLPDHELECVSKNARSLVEREFAFEKTVERWETIFQDI